MLNVINFSLEQNFSKCIFSVGKDCQSLHFLPPACFIALLALLCKSLHGLHGEEGGDGRGGSGQQLSLITEHVCMQCTLGTGLSFIPSQNPAIPREPAHVVMPSLFIEQVGLSGREGHATHSWEEG